MGTTTSREDDEKTVAAWRAWWRGVTSPDAELEPGRRKVEQAFEARESDNLRRLQAAELRAILPVSHQPQGLVTRISDATNTRFYCWPYGDVLPLEQLVRDGHAPIPAAMHDDLRANEPELYRRLIDQMHMEITTTDGTRAIRIGLTSPRAPDPALADEEAHAATVNLVRLRKAANAIVVASVGSIMLGRDSIASFYPWDWLVGAPDPSTSIGVVLPERSRAISVVYAAHTNDRRVIAFLRGGPTKYTLVDPTNGVLPATPERIAKLRARVSP